MLTADERKQFMENIRTLPARLEALVKNLSVEDLTTPYMKDEWTVAQNVHHLADSHMNAFVRLKLMLTENAPGLKNYQQELWAELPDANNPYIETSLSLLKGLHARWSALLDSLKDSDWNRVAIHPEYGETNPDKQLEIYGNHGEGHIDQIKRTLAAKGQ